MSKGKVVRSTDLLAPYAGRVKTTPASQTMAAKAAFKSRVGSKLKEQTSLRGDALAQVSKLKLR